MNNFNSLDDFLIFLEVVQSGSFTKASDRLRIPKANLSRKVSRLEQDLGVKLLERTTRTQHLTEQGNIFLKHCQKIKSEIDLACSSLAESIEQISGTIKIGTSVGVAHEVLKDEMFKFLNAYDDLSLDLVLTNKRVDLITEGYDILVRIGKMEDSSFIAKKLGSINRKLFCHPDLLKECGEIKTLNDLKKVRLLLMGSIYKDNGVELQSNKKSFKLQPKKKLIIDDFSLLKQAAIDKLGIAIIPTYMCKDELKTNNLINILPEWSMQSIDVYAVYPKYRSKIQKVRVFLDFLSYCFSRKLEGSL